MALSRALVAALAAHLRDEVTGIAKVYEEWPDRNQALSYPSISIISGEAAFTRCAPYLKEIGDVVDHEAETTYVVGDFTIPLQLDIWARYKPERDTFMQRVFAALQPSNGQGLCLQLAAYFDEWAGYMMQGQRYPDSGETVTLQEWRAIISLEATCRAVSTTTEYIITQEPELTLTTPNTPILPEE
jgi:hypothetical protein